MLTYGETLVQEDWHRERMHLIREESNTRRMLRGLEESAPFYSGILMWLGHRLVVWGRNLQERYSTATPSPMPQSVNRLAN